MAYRETEATRNYSFRIHGALPPKADVSPEVRRQRVLVDGDSTEPIEGTLPPNWHDWAGPFLEALRNCGNLRVACAAAGVSRRVIYQARHLHPEFAERWDEAMDDAVDIIEAKAWEVATRQNNAIMIIFLLKSLRPSVYKDQQRIEMVVTPDVTRMSEEQLIKLIQGGGVDSPEDGA